MIKSFSLKQWQESARRTLSGLPAWIENNLPSLRVSLQYGLVQLTNTDFQGFMSKKLMATLIDASVHFQFSSSTVFLICGSAIVSVGLVCFTSILVVVVWKGVALCQTTVQVCGSVCETVLKATGEVCQSIFQFLGCVGRSHHCDIMLQQLCNKLCDQHKLADCTWEMLPTSLG